MKNLRHDGSIGIGRNFRVLDGLDKVLLRLRRKDHVSPSIGLCCIAHSESTAAFLDRLNSGAADDLIGHLVYRVE